MSPRTLVTGATGFIGSYVVEQLVREGVDVRVLVRRPEALPAATRAVVEVCPGDVRDLDAIDRAVRGVHTVLHLAACARAWARDAREFQAVNVDAVHRLLAAARHYEVASLVHVSTILTLPPFRPASVNGRSTRPTLYERTKRDGEGLVERYVAEGRHAVIVHPTRVYGPGPLTDANAVTKVMALYLAGRFRVRLSDRDALGNYVHAADVAAGIIAAARSTRSGVHYVLGGENASLRAFLTVVSEVAGVRHRMLALSPWLALAFAHLCEGWGRLGGSAAITPGWVRVFLEDRRVNCLAARRDFGYSPRSLRQGVEETIGWLTRHGVGMAG